MSDLTVEAGEVVGALERAIELAEVWLIDGAPGSNEERVAVFRALRDYTKRGGRLATVIADLEQAIVKSLPLDQPVTIDGQMYRTHRTPNRKGYDKDALRSAINTVALAPVPEFDIHTGEVAGHRPPTAAEAIDVVWKAADVATGRTKVLPTVFGIDLDEYAQTEWRTRLEEVDEFAIHPDNREGTTEP